MEHRYFSGLVSNDVLAGFLGLPGSKIESMTITPVEDGVFSMIAIGSFKQPETKTVTKVETEVGTEPVSESEPVE